MEEFVSQLTDKCGHHCGVQQIGKATRVGHCPCSECHDTDNKEK